MIITIGRQFGSGGRQVGKLLAARLGYAFYDKELLRMAAEAGGMNPEIAHKFDEKPIRSMIYSTYIHTATALSDTQPLNQRLAFSQFDVIRKLAEEGKCVIVGRCADYVLQENPDCLNVFLHAPLAFRHKHAVEAYGIAESLVEKTIRKQDKGRADYYSFFTQHRWGDASNYHLTMDTSRLGIERTADMLALYVRECGG